MAHRFYNAIFSVIDEQKQETSENKVSPSLVKLQSD